MSEDKDPTESYLALVDSAYDKTKARIKELERILSSGPCEIAAHSNSLKEYMSHWEGRALDAEAKLAKAVKVLVLCRDMFDEVAHPADPMSVLLNTTLAELEGDRT